jgi:aminotransferase EvaB
MVAVPFNDLSRGWLANSEEAQAACKRVIRSGHYVHGPEHMAFEIELAEFLGAEAAIGVASGTDALYLALKTVGCGRGSKIITSANAGGYTSVVAAGIGCEIIYCDVDSESLVITDVSLAPLLSRDIHAVVITHLYGNIAPVDRIIELCEPLGIKVVEDCAQAIGGRIGTRHVGTVGDIGAFSFYPTKNLGAAGDGGAVVTNDPVLASTVRKLRQYGWNGRYSIEISGGINSRLDEIQAAILRIGLPKIDSLNAKRREIVTHYRQALLNTRVHMVTENSLSSTSHLAVLRVPKEIGRDRFQNELATKGIQTAVHYPILDCDQPGLPNRGADYQVPVSRAAIAEIISLPCFPEITASEVTAVITAILETVG